jgi:cell division control protein 24
LPLRASGYLLSAYYIASNVPSQHALEVWWRGDDDLEYFTLRCRTEEQMKQWEAQVNRLIKEAAQRRASDRGFSKIMSHISNSTSPAPGRSMVSSNHDRSTSMSSHSIYPGPLPLPDAVNGRMRQVSPYGNEEQFETTPNGSYPHGPKGYPPPDGFEFDDDEFEDYPPPSSLTSSGPGTPSGRGTPMGAPRRNNAMSMPPEHDAVPGYDRPRARTEDTNGFVMAQWRSGASIVPPPPPSGALPAVPHRPLTPRLTSNTSTSSYASDSSFGSTVRPQQAKLRSQFSSTKLKSVYDGDSRHMNPPAMSGNGVSIPNRSRSASQPNSYIPLGSQPPPPLPHAPWINRTTPSTSNGNKRGSGSSHSTGDSSDYSPNSSSPITPFGSSESSLAGVGIHSSLAFRDSADASTNNQQIPPPVKVKVHFHEDIFVVQVPRAVDYNELLEKVGRKIRLCGPRRDDGPLRVKYKDEDGDMISLGSTEDVQMAFESYRPGGQVILFVT